ncbi:LOW QUALITY PROTEIN: hypothetical protein V2J09_004579 [Rumex salicifolius]
MESSVEAIRAIREMDAGYDDVVPMDLGTDVPVGTQHDSQVDAFSSLSNTMSEVQGEIWHNEQGSDVKAEKEHLPSSSIQRPIITPSLTTPPRSQATPSSTRPPPTNSIVPPPMMTLLALFSFLLPSLRTFHTFLAHCLYDIEELEQHQDPPLRPRAAPPEMTWIWRYFPAFSKRMSLRPTNLANRRAATIDDPGPISIQDPGRLRLIRQALDMIRAEESITHPLVDPSSQPHGLPGNGTRVPRPFAIDMITRTLTPCHHLLGFLRTHNTRLEKGVVQRELNEEMSNTMIVSMLHMSNTKLKKGVVQRQLTKEMSNARIASMLYVISFRLYASLL